MVADNVVLIIKLFICCILFFCFFIKIYMYIYLIENTHFLYVKFIVNFSIFMLIMCFCIVTVSTST